MLIAVFTDGLSRLHFRKTCFHAAEVLPAVLGSSGRSIPHKLDEVKQFAFICHIAEITSPLTVKNMQYLFIQMGLVVLDFI